MHSSCCCVRPALHGLLMGLVGSLQAWEAVPWSDDACAGVRTFGGQLVACGLRRAHGQVVGHTQVHKEERRAGTAVCVMTTAATVEGYAARLQLVVLTR